MSLTTSSDPAASQDASFVHDVYRVLLGREPDEAGLRTYLGELGSGRLNRQGVLNEFMWSGEFAGRYRSLTSGVREPDGCTRAEAMEVFRRFPRYTGPGRPGYITNAFGGLSEVAVSARLANDGGRVEDYPIPGNFHGEALEWVGTLRAALDSQDSFAMIELGAGWGPWCVIGAMAAKQRGVRTVRVLGIEADVGHVAFMQRNFVANGLTPDEGAVLHGAIGIDNGTAFFPRAKSAAQVYGGAAAYTNQDRETGPFAAFMSSSSDMIEDVEAVPCHALADQLSKFETLDLLHCDIQGAEGDLLPATIDLLDARVRRLVVGTHSFAIDRGLAAVMGGHGWICEGISACQMSASGEAAQLVDDGMQVWRNPRLFR